MSVPMTLRITTAFIIAAIPCFAPFNASLARCPVPFRPSAAVLSIAHREGFDRPNSLPRKLRNPCALRTIHYLKFPDQESGWRRCEFDLDRMTDDLAIHAWNLKGRTDPLSLKVIEAIHNRKKWSGFMYGVGR